MDSLRTVAIVQARMGSSRLPGKVLLDVGGESMLARVVRRVRRAAAVDDLVVATTTAPADAAVVAECRLLEVAVFPGDEHDVLDRFYRAAQAHAAGAVVRITADCPLIDPGVIDRVVDDFHVWAPDYASNVLERTYPRGLDTEVISFPALERAWHEASEPYQRAHVTPYFYQNPGRFRLLSVTTGDADLPSSSFSSFGRGLPWPVPEGRDRPTAPPTDSPFERGLPTSSFRRGLPTAPSQSSFRRGLLTAPPQSSFRRGLPTAPSTAPPQAAADYSAHRWTVDTAQDLSFVREVYRRLAEPFSWTDVLDLLAAEPALAEINRAVRQKALHEG